MPEEINRLLTHALADYLFVTEESGVENLLREGRPRERIYLVGNLMVDALRQYLTVAEESHIGADLGLVDGFGYIPFAVLTLHRPSNVDSPEVLERLLDAVSTIAEELPVIFPVHPRTKEKLRIRGSKEHPGLRMIPPVGYLEFLCLINHARLVLTDSGGIQEETTALGVPCLTLRHNTERPVTVFQGTNHVVGTDPTKIITGRRILAGRTKTARIPPLWDGRAAERIVQILLREVPCHAQPVLEP